MKTLFGLAGLSLFLLLSIVSVSEARIDQYMYRPVIRPQQIEIYSYDWYDCDGSTSGTKVHQVISWVDEFGCWIITTSYCDGTWINYGRVVPSNPLDSSGTGLGIHIPSNFVALQPYFNLTYGQPSGAFIWAGIYKYVAINAADYGDAQYLEARRQAMIAAFPQYE